MRSVMEFHQLRYFVAAAEDQSFTRAAGRVHVSQPALSKQVALLEDELGVKLFERVRQRVRLTEAGRYFLPRARKLICDSQTLAQQTAEMFGDASRTLRLGFLAPFADDLVAPVVRDFRNRFPAVSVSLFELAPTAQIERLLLRELDAAILGNIDQSIRASLETTLLSRHRMDLIVPESHQLAQRRSVLLRELQNDPWISLSDALFPGRRAFLQSACRRAGFEPDIIMEADSLTLMTAAVGAGQGVAMIPEHTRKLPHYGVVYLPIRSPVIRTELMFVTLPENSFPELSELRRLIIAKAAGLFGSP